MTTATSAARPKVDWLSPTTIGFLLVKTLGVLGIVLHATGVIDASWRDYLLGFILWRVRALAVAGGLHRYFSHRTYELRFQRFSQFVLGTICCTAMQKGPLWWAAEHRDHHRNSDEPIDKHSPTQHGFAYAQWGWFLSRWPKLDYKKKIPDFAKFPELMWLERLQIVPFALLGLACYLYGGWSCLLISFFLSTAVLGEATSTINTLAHLWGKRPYQTKDTSRNSFLLALLVGGEGWHNNHHHEQWWMFQGEKKWQVDTAGYLIWTLQWFGVTKNIKMRSKRMQFRLAAPARELA